MSSFIRFLNIIDKHTLTCQLINYLRYVLRATSAYTIVLFSIQRLFIVYSPLTNKFKSTRSAWITMSVIVSISVVLNVWVPWLFEIKKEDSSKSCDVKEEWSQDYFNITLIYICIIMLLPILVIFVCNFLIIFKVLREKSKQKTFNGDVEMILRHKSAIVIKTTIVEKKTKSGIGGVNSVDCTIDKTKQRPYFLNMDQIIRRVTIKANSTRLLTKMLLLISFSYALCNLPYFVTWSLYYFELTFSKNEVVVHNLLYSIAEISEVHMRTIFP